MLFQIGQSLQQQMIESPTPSGLLSISCGIKQRCVLQVFKKQQIEGNRQRLFLSDGSVIMCAQIDARQIKGIKDKSMIRVELEYYGYHKPMSISWFQILEANCPNIFGNPIPFIDYLNNRAMNSYAETISASASSVKTQRQNSTKSPTKYRAEDQPTQRRVLMVEDIDRELEKQDHVTNVQHSPKKNDKSGTSSEQEKMQQLIENSYTSIADLYPKMKGWKLLARVTWMENKICTSTKGIKTGQKMLVINFRIMDSSGQVKCSLFDEAAHKYKDLLKKGSVYEFSGGTLIQQAAKIQNRFYHQEQKTAVTIRFETYSKIFDKNDSKQAQSIPLNQYRLSSFALLNTFSVEDEFDIAGFIKTVVKCEPTTTQKKKLTFILASPIQRTQIQVAAYIDPSEVEKLQSNKIVILKSIKVGVREDSLIFLRSCYNTQIITEFSQDERIFCQIRQLMSQVGEYESLSQVRFYRRSLRQLEDTLKLITGRQNIYSKIHCYFMGVTDERKFTYQACYKCNKKISIVDRYSNFCPKCAKIVQIKQQYLLKGIFADHTGQLKVAVMGDSAKAVMGIGPQQFSKMPYDKQLQTMKSACFKQFVLSMRTSKMDDCINHSIFTIELPQAGSNIDLIIRYLGDQIKFEEEQPNQNL